jgi:hypothetical protein
MAIRKASVLGAVCLVALAGEAAAARGPAGPEVSREQLKAQLEAAQEAYRVAEAVYTANEGDAETVYRWSVRWMNAQRDLAAAKAERVAAVEDHVKRMQKLEQMAEARHKVGLPGSPLEANAAKFYCVQAEGWLAREKARKE